MGTIASLFHLDGSTDEQLLVAALHGDPAAWKRLTRRFEPYLRAVVRRRARAMPNDLHGEITSEVWTAVILRGPACFNPLTITARDYISSFVKDATDRVRAAYRAPGERSRARDGHRPRKRPSRVGDQPRAVVVRFDELPEEEQPKAQGEWERIDRNIDIDWAQALAPSDVALAIDLIRYWGVGFEEAAGVVGISRAMLLRELAQLGRRLEAA
jgi:DNA-directed RNA polymerase specialized sigma24 family protein